MASIAMASPHFSREELSCRHCGQYGVSIYLVCALEELRALGPEIIKVHDAYRCKIHNAAVGGVPNSEHPMGEAADIEIVGLTLRQMFDRACKIPAFQNGGIGLYDGKPFIHVDIRPMKARWARVNGEYVSITRLLTT